MSVALTTFLRNQFFLFLSVCALTGHVVRCYRSFQLVLGVSYFPGAEIIDIGAGGQRREWNSTNWLIIGKLGAIKSLRAQICSLAGTENNWNNIADAFLAAEWELRDVSVWITFSFVTDYHYFINLNRRNGCHASSTCFLITPIRM